MFGKKSIHDEYARIIREIDEGQRREPVHNRPDALKSKWGNVDLVDQYVFDEFAWFGATLDKWTNEPWSLEETSDIGRRANYLESPEYGRRWIVYYNELKIGWMEASAMPDKILGTLDEFKTDPVARIDMTLNFMRFIPSDDAFQLLYQASFLMQSTQDGYDTARGHAKLAAESTMTHYMWEAMRAGDQYVPDMDFSSEGQFAVYSETIAHWRDSGFDPVVTRGRD